MKEIGYIIENIGYNIMPISFIAYFILKILEFKWNKKGYSSLAKSIWYIVVGISTLDGDIRVEKLVIMMIFFDAFDSFIEYKEENRKSKNS
ncbi:hypothetical protein EXM99_08265 [Clostridium botulinum]|nr:hypothetical protein [Clostridium botulinum]NFF13758.1 hypothetical protein [Clostridium botulinum]